MSTDSATPSTTSADASAGAPLDAFAGTLRRTEVQRGPLSVPGRVMVQVLTEIPVGVESGWHTHPGEEVGYIATGTVEMQVRGEPTRTLQAGDGFLIPPGVPHNARDLGPGTGRMLSTYVVDPDLPRVTLLPSLPPVSSAARRRGRPSPPPGRRRRPRRRGARRA